MPEARLRVVRGLLLIGRTGTWKITESRIQKR
jgi:hypothetical protein